MIVKGTGKKDKAGNLLKKGEEFDVSERVADILIKKGMAEKPGAKKSKKSATNKQDDPTEEKQVKAKK